MEQLHASWCNDFRRQQLDGKRQSWKRPKSSSGLHHVDNDDDVHLGRKMMMMMMFSN